MMFWAGIRYGHKTPLLCIESSLNSRGYILDILEPIVLPVARQVGPGFVYQDDNARAHRARIVNEWFSDHGVEHMEWPAMSPDMNPIEHAWDRLKTALSARSEPISGMTGLWIAAT